MTDKRPYISQELVDYLKRDFTLERALEIKDDNKTVTSADEFVGIIRGFNSIINHLDALLRLQE